MSEMLRHKAFVEVGFQQFTQQHGWDIPTEYQLRQWTPEQITRKSAKQKEGRTNKTLAMPKFEQNSGGLTRCQSLTHKFHMIQVSRHTDTDKGARGQV
jgi:hypothetical protein